MFAFTLVAAQIRSLRRKYSDFAAEARSQGSDLTSGCRNIYQHKCDRHQQERIQIMK